MITGATDRFNIPCLQWSERQDGDETKREEERGERGHYKACTHNARAQTASTNAKDCKHTQTASEGGSKGKAKGDSTEKRRIGEAEPRGAIDCV